MKEPDKLIFREFFKTYYFLNSKIIRREIREIALREFAYMDFNDVMHRHIAIKEEDFENWVVEKIPRDFYHSSGYYLFPDKPMDNKMWIKGEVIFDIDIDHITACNPTKIWICTNCDEVYFNSTKECEICHGSINEVLILNEYSCIKAKDELKKLVNLLNSDLGIDMSKFARIYFSGSRGFHVHVFDPSFMELGQRERVEIKDYITYEMFDITYIRSITAKAIVELKKIMEKMTESEVIDDKIRSKIIDLINKGKVSELKGIFRRRKRLREYVNILLRQKLGVCVDSIVTVDLSRLIRVPYSLHGKTGLIKKRIEIDKIDEFYPFSDAVYNTGEKAKVFVKYLPNILWLDREYEETFKSYVEVPMSLAIYLVGRGLAYGIKRI